MAREAGTIAGRYAAPPRPLSWLNNFVRRMAPGPAPTRYTRVEPGRPRPSEVEEDGALIPADVREKLRAIVGPGIERARVHTGVAADAFARAHGADAVTVGDHIAFRDGHYRPHEPAGLALLAHETTHVVASTSSAQLAARSTATGIATEEASARAAEVLALDASQRALPINPMPVTATTSFGPLHRSLSIAPTPVAAPAPSPAARPMAAASDRGGSPATPSQPFDVAELKRSIYRELLQTIRSDAERGG